MFQRFCLGVLSAISAFWRTINRSKEEGLPPPVTYDLSRIPKVTVPVVEEPDAVGSAKDDPDPIDVEDLPSDDELTRPL
jgi:hypothetical protein